MKQISLPLNPFSFLMAEVTINDAPSFKMNIMDTARFLDSLSKNGWVIADKINDK